MNTPLVAAGDRSFSDPETLVTLNLFQGRDDRGRGMTVECHAERPLSSC